MVPRTACVHKPKQDNQDGFSNSKPSVSSDSAHTDAVHISSNQIKHNMEIIFIVLLLLFIFLPR